MRRRAAAALLLLALTGCAGAAAGVHGVAATGVAGAVAQLDELRVADRLFLGRVIPAGGTVSDSAWAVFVEEVVTPHFPEGLTVWRAEGQWRDPAGVVIREPVMVLELFHADIPEADAAVEAIALEYRRRFRQEAVLRVRLPASVRMYD